MLANPDLQREAIDTIDNANRFTVILKNALKPANHRLNEKAILIINQLLPTNFVNIKPNSIIICKLYSMMISSQSLKYWDYNLMNR